MLARAVTPSSFKVPLQKETRGGEESYPCGSGAGGGGKGGQHRTDALPRQARIPPVSAALHHEADFCDTTSENYPALQSGCEAFHKPQASRELKHLAPLYACPPRRSKLLHLTPMRLLSPSLPAFDRPLALSPSGYTGLISCPFFVVLTQGRSTGGSSAPSGPMTAQ